MENHRTVKRDKVDILSVQFDNVTMDEMRHYVTEFVEADTTDNMFVVTANPEIVDYALEERSYYDLIGEADFIIPDGTGIIQAGRILGTPLKERVPGIEFMAACLAIAERHRQKVFLLGASEKVVNEAVKYLQADYPHIEFASHHGYIDVGDEKVARQVSTFNPDYVFVGMGYPKQEEWIKRHRHRLQHTLLMGVGGSIEVYSGTKKRAPWVFRKLNLEWFYRLITDWKRMTRMQRLPRFVSKVFQTRRKK
ncbi:putative teichoic acid biosynthesis protein [Staphylococcus piscifermentans]|uniref:N-acetylglucosaminyldiphosphoundecaprenol N-acetyl-beta-D-mannosaminyltransferase n=1 Tax=Staphylococcus piscifermentans TaxID=70258 RepID=A0A239UGI5_9STAP|nr:N-acetylglucosaminyldiphosphoundecaprenol N-acetyl-beta-D-mannosaminyltransferase TarA [Staphylococcus piscifermentans]RTX84940.1 glycosyltransferase [Staphylococcus piscifermentans]GEP85552.1 N-acetylmannosaminyltransferase [Staphylococcus piscifermentans]SNV08508.1 putative teichoic acid biosynthesis protein [Staphylococcus piscifermentans]